MIERFELYSLSILLESIHPSSNPNKGIWSLVSSGVFSCKSQFLLLTHSPIEVNSFSIKPPGGPNLPLRSNLLCGRLCLTGLTLMICSRSTGLSLLCLPICVCRAAPIWKLGLISFCIGLRWQLLIFFVLWCSWLERNATIFSGTFPSLDFICDGVVFQHLFGVQLMAFLEVSHCLICRDSGMLCYMTQSQFFPL